MLYSGFTVLDAIGPYQVLTHLPAAEVVFVAERSGPIPDDLGSLRLVVDADLAEVTNPDIVLVPGGAGKTDLLTAGPVHMALALAGRIAGDGAAQAIQLGIEYDPHPPYDAGSPGTAPPEVVERLRTANRSILTG